MDALREKLQALQRRWVWVRFLQNAMLSLPLLWLVCSILSLLSLWIRSHPMGWSLFLSLSGSTLLGAGILALLKRPALDEIARLADQTIGTRERLITAWRLGQDSEAILHPVARLALQDCLAILGKVDRHNAFPNPRNRYAWWLLSPLASFFLITWVPVSPTPPFTDPEEQNTDSLVATETAESLEKLASELDKQVLPPELESWLAELRESAERLKEAQSVQGSDPLRESLKEISSLEQLLETLRAQAKKSAVSPEELSALAEALAANEAGQEAAAALKRGDVSGAAESLERLARELGESPDASERLQQLAESLSQQAETLTEEQRGQVAQQMQQARDNAESAEAMRDLLQQISELMKELAANQPPAPKDQNQEGQGQQSQAGDGQQGQGSAMDEESLRQLLQALQEMKERMQEGGDPGSPQPGEGGEQPGGGEGSLMAMPFGDGKDASGMPGSELDFGEGDFPTENSDATVSTEGPASRITGRPEGGEKLSQSVAAAGDSGEARTRYKEQFESATSADAESLNREEIPIGSRVYIRRYFEMIRPVE